MDIKTPLDLQPAVCATCSIVFAVAGIFFDERRRSHGQIYCPNGHSLRLDRVAHAGQKVIERRAVNDKLAAVEFELARERTMVRRLRRRAQKVLGM